MRPNRFVTVCITPSLSDMKLHYGDLTDSTCLVKIINQVKPSEIYNLGAQSHVKVLRPQTHPHTLRYLPMYLLSVQHT